jgi:hypothetical protein
METSIDVAPMAHWNGIDNTKEVHPTQVADLIKSGWVILMSYQRRLDIPHQEYSPNGTLYNTRSEYEPVVLMGQTSLDSFREQIAGAALVIKDLRVKEAELHELTKKQVILENSQNALRNEVARQEKELETKRSECSILMTAKYKMESDIGKIRSALGEIRMKEILG